MIPKTEATTEAKAVSIAERHSTGDFAGEFRRQVQKAPWYLTSLAIHGLMLMLAAFIVIRPARAADIRIDIVSRIVPDDPEIVEEVLPERENVKEVRDLPQIDPTFDGEVLPVEDVPIMLETNYDEDVSDDSPVQGDPQNLNYSTVAGPPGLFAVMGPGGGSGGGWGRFGTRGDGPSQARTSGVKPKKLVIDAGLTWLARHQEPNGSWNCTKYEGNKEDGDIGVSALACLAFLGDGHSPAAKSKYQATVKRGIDWLISQQKPDGSFRNCRNYGNGTAAMAVCEAAGMGYYGAEQAAKRAVDYLISAQGADGGWNYTSLHNKPGRNDNSVSGWCIMALKSAYLSGIEFDKKAVWDKFDKYLKKAVRVEAGESYEVSAKACYVFDTQKGEWKAGSTAMQAASLLMVIYQGYRQNDPTLRALVGNVMKSAEIGNRNMDGYTAYYATLAMFLSGHKTPEWAAFHQKVFPAIENTQRRGDPSVDGSWDPSGGHSDASGGRVMTTAMKVMCLSVFKRFPPVFHDMATAGAQTAQNANATD